MGPGRGRAGSACALGAIPTRGHMDAGGQGGEGSRRWGGSKDKREMMMGEHKKNWCNGQVLCVGGAVSTLPLNADALNSGKHFRNLIVPCPLHIPLVYKKRRL